MGQETGKTAPGVRQLEDGTYMCEADSTVFSRVRYAERHARLFGGMNGNGSNANTAGQESAAEAMKMGPFEELDLYAQARCLILDADVVEEKRRLAISIHGEGQDLGLPPVPSEDANRNDVTSMRKQETVDDEFLKGINSKLETSRSALLSSLVAESKVRKRKCIKKRRRELAKYNTRLVVLLGSIYKPIDP